MLDLVLARMRQLDLIRDERAAHCNVFVRLDNVLANVFDADGRYYYLRMADAYDLEGEFQVAESVARTVGRFVPQPLAFFREGRLSCMVVEGVHFDIVTGEQLIRARPTSPLAKELLAYFCHASSAMAVPDRKADVGASVEILTERYRGTEQASLWNRVLQQSNLDWLKSLHRQKQHGDFVPNNFGMRSNGLVIFDWEDFGKVDLPGFDLAVLFGALVDFQPRKLRALRDAVLSGSTRGAIPWLGEACRLSRVDQHHFLHALPFYLSLFMWLKDRYSPAIRLKVNSAIVALL